MATSCRCGQHFMRIFHAWANVLAFSPGGLLTQEQGERGWHDMKHGVVFAIFAALMLPASGAAQFAPDHFTCFKVKDRARISANLNLFSSYPSLNIPLGCALKEKVQFFCTMGRADLLGDPVDKSSPPLAEGGGEFEQYLWVSQLCYKVKCPKGNAQEMLLYDRFGARTVEKIKNPRLVCTAASPFPPCGDLTSAPQCAGMCSPGSTCRESLNNPGVCKCFAENLDCETDASPPDCAGICLHVGAICVEDGAGGCMCAFEP